MMDLLKKVFILFILIILLISYITIQEKNHFEKAAILIKLEGKIYNSKNENQTYCLIPDEQNFNNKIIIDNLKNKYFYSNKLSLGDYNKWKLFKINIGYISSEDQIFFLDEIYKNVIIRDNKLTIFPFKISFGINNDLKFQELSKSDIQSLINYIKRNTKKLQYNSILLGNENITIK